MQRSPSECSQSLEASHAVRTCATTHAPSASHARPRACSLDALLNRRTRRGRPSPTRYAPTSEHSASRVTSPIGDVPPPCSARARMSSLVFALLGFEALWLLSACGGRNSTGERSVAWSHARPRVFDSAAPKSDSTNRGRTTLAGLVHGRRVSSLARLVARGLESLRRDCELRASGWM